jgi:hypothetical protein
VFIKVPHRFCIAPPSTKNQSPSDSLSLASSFYGPGAVAYWYLTFLSCLVSRTFNPKKGESDSITSDFITLITYPTVSSTHLIAQVQSYLYLGASDLVTLRQRLVSIGASLAITDVYMTFCIFLLLPTTPRNSFKHTLLLALSGKFPWELLHTKARFK